MQFGSKKLFSLVSAFALAWLALRFALPLLAPFLFGGALALAAEPLVKCLNRRLRLPRPVCAGIGISMAFFLLAALLLILCAALIRELGLLAGSLPDIALTLQNSIALLRSWLLGLSSHAPQSLQPLLQENVQSLFSSGTALLDQTVRYILGLAGNLLSHIPDSALTVGTAVLSGFMISAKLPRLRRQLLRSIPSARLEQLRTVGKRMGRALFGWLKAQLKLMGVTFALLLMGFFLLRIPNAPLWAVGIALVDAFPILGTGTVLLPWCLIKLLQGDAARAIGLAGIYVTISLIRSALEPRLVGSHLGLDPLVTLVALYAGFQLWGIGGMLLAPLLTVTVMQILPQKRQT